MRQLWELPIDKIYELLSYIIFENANREWQVLSQREGLEPADRVRLAEVGRIRRAMDMGGGDDKLKELQSRIDRINMRM